MPQKTFQPNLNKHPFTSLYPRPGQPKNLIPSITSKSSPSVIPAILIPQISPPARPISRNFQDSRPSARLPKAHIFQV
jgi:hypothetical protein